MNKLEPCPFCGAHAETDFDNAHHSYRIECSTLNCGTGPICGKPEEAIAGWNARAERDALRAAISEHNKECARQCNQRKEMGASYCPMKGYDRDCGDCPRYGMVEPPPSK